MLISTFLTLVLRCRFWGRKIAGPWRAQDPSALDLLHTLLQSVMVRHSKSQTVLGTGEPLLTLPGNLTASLSLDDSLAYSRSLDNLLDDSLAYPHLLDDSLTYSHSGRRTRIVPLQSEGSEAAVVAYLEALGARLCAAGGLSDSVGGAQNARIRLIGLLRKACVAPCLINGGMGCREMLTYVNTLVRQEEELSGRVAAHGQLHENAVGGAVGLLGRIPVMSIEDALKVLNSVSHENRSAGADMVVHGMAARRNNDSDRIRKSSLLGQSSDPR